MNNTVYIGMGSNQGDREKNLLQALEALSRIDAVAVLGCSSLYDSAPAGASHPRCLNAVVQLECELAPQRLLAICKQVEKDLGRNPRVKSTAWPIDLDILLWENLLVADANLQVPHLDLHKRRAALEPLCELAPQLRHPVMDVTITQLLRHLSGQDVVPHDSNEWPVVNDAPGDG